MTPAISDSYLRTSLSYEMIRLAKIGLESKRARSENPSPRRRGDDGVGSKLALYVPKEDEFVLEEIRKLCAKHARKKIKSSRSSELIRLVRIGLKSRRA